MEQRRIVQQLVSNLILSFHVALLRNAKLGPRRRQLIAQLLVDTLEKLELASHAVRRRVLATTTVAVVQVGEVLQFETIVSIGLEFLLHTFSNVNQLIFNYLLRNLFSYVQNFVQTGTFDEKLFDLGVGLLRLCTTGRLAVDDLQLLVYLNEAFAQQRVLVLQLAHHQLHQLLVLLGHELVVVAASVFVRRIATTVRIRVALRVLPLCRVVGRQRVERVRVVLENAGDGLLGADLLGQLAYLELERVSLLAQVLDLLLEHVDEGAALLGAYAAQVVQLVDVELLLGLHAQLGAQVVVLLQHVAERVVELVEVLGEGLDVRVAHLELALERLDLVDRLLQLIVARLVLAHAHERLVERSLLLDRVALALAETRLALAQHALQVDDALLERLVRVRGLIRLGLTLGSLVVGLVHALDDGGALVHLSRVLFDLLLEDLDLLVLFLQHFAQRRHGLFVRVESVAVLLLFAVDDHGAQLLDLLVFGRDDKLEQKNTTKLE